MIHSMTAFARSEIVTEALTVNMEIRSVNSRHLAPPVHMNGIIRHQPIK